MRLDKFVYDPNGSSGRVVLQRPLKGAFRFVTFCASVCAVQSSKPTDQRTRAGGTVKYLRRYRKARRGRGKLHHQ